MIQEWDIKQRQNNCEECQKPFEDQQALYSVLTHDEEGYVRTDFCNTCWDIRGQAHPYFSAWQSQFRLPPPPAEDPLKKETAESLLRALMKQEDESLINVIYILAVMLERKRILIERSVEISEENRRIIFYEHRRTGETFLIPDPRLHLDQLQHVQEEVVALLSTDQESTSPVAVTDPTGVPEPAEAHEG